MKGLIREAWECYNRDVLPRDAPPVQRSECRRAFYSGAQALLGIVACIGDDSVSEADGVGILEGLRGELDGFARLIKSGRA